MHYRIYSLSRDTGRILYATDVIADDDLAAVREGRARHDGAPFEVWCQARRVHCSPIGPPAGPANEVG